MKIPSSRTYPRIFSSARTHPRQIGKTAPMRYCRSYPRSDFQEGKRSTLCEDRETPLFSQARELIDYGTNKINIIESLPRLSERLLVVTANGILGKLLGRPFVVCISSLRDVPVLIPKHSAVGWTSTEPARIVVISKETPTESPSPDVSSRSLQPQVRYRQQSNHLEMRLLHRKSSTKMTDPIGRYRIQQPRRGMKPRHRQPSMARRVGTHKSLSGGTHQSKRTKMLEFLTPFAKIRDGNLSNTRSVKHSIDLRPNSTAVHQPPYRIGPHNHTP